MTMPEPLDWDLLLEARQAPFSRQVLGQDAILCLECGQFFVVLGTHLQFAHDLTSDEYRELWGYNRGQGLASISFRDKQRSCAGIKKAMLQARQAATRPPRQAFHNRPMRPQFLAAFEEQQRQIAERRRTAPDSVSATEVLEHYRKGIPLYRIAEILRCSERAVSRRLHESGLSTRRRRKYPHVTRERILQLLYQGLRQDQCAAELGCPVDFLRRILIRTRPAISRVVALELLAQGRTVKQVGQYFGVPKDVVERLLPDVIETRPVSNPAHNRYRADLDVDTMVALRRQEWSLEAIAQHLHCGATTVAARLKAVRQFHPVETRWIVVPAEELIKCRRQGMGLAELAKRFGCSKATIAARIKELGSPPSVSWNRRLDLTVTAVLERLRQGRTMAGIAAEFNCSLSTIRQRVKEAERKRWGQS